MKHIEDYIRNKIDMFNTDSPQHNLLHTIEKQLPAQRKNVRVWKAVAVAASISLIISIIAIWQISQRNQTTSAQTVVTQKKDVVTDSIQLMMQVLQVKRTELETNTRDNAVFYNEFMSNLNTLSDDFNKMKESLPASPNSQKLLMYMLYNLKLQIELINEQLQNQNSLNKKSKVTI